MTQRITAPSVFCRLACYKLYARILAARLSAGLDPFLRENQYGCFRHGRSTNEAIFLIRRLQDLVDAKRNQALFPSLPGLEQGVWHHQTCCPSPGSPKIENPTQDVFCHKGPHCLSSIWSCCQRGDLSAEKAGKWYTPRLYLVTIVVYCLAGSYVSRHRKGVPW